MVVTQVKSCEHAQVGKWIFMKKSKLIIVQFSGKYKMYNVIGDLYFRFGSKEG